MSRNYDFPYDDPTRMQPWQWRVMMEGVGFMGLLMLNMSAANTDHSADIESAHGHTVVAGELTDKLKSPTSNLPASQDSESIQHISADIPQNVMDYSIPLYLEGVLGMEAALYVVSRRRKIPDHERCDLNADEKAQFAEIQRHFDN